MRALIRIGPSNAVTYASDHPEPLPSDIPEYYTIRTESVALTRQELTWPEPLLAKPPIPGYDLAGIIISAPIAPHPEGKAYKFKPGDEVYGFTGFSLVGNAREVTVAAEKELALKPRNLSWEEAAAVPLSALTAYQGLFVHGRLKPAFATGESENTGKRALITAASGGVGIWALQLAHLAGIEVVGTCGPSNVDFVKSLGADKVLDYSKINLLNWVNEDREARGFDVILDCVGGKILPDLFKCTRKDGRVVGVAEPPEPKKPEDGIAEGVQSVWFIVEPHGAQLEEVSGLIEQGKVRVMVDSVFSLERFEEAFEKVETGHAKGKVVLKLN